MRPRCKFAFISQKIKYLQHLVLTAHPCAAKFFTLCKNLLSIYFFSNTLSYPPILERIPSMYYLQIPNRPYEHITYRSRCQTQNCTAQQQRLPNINKLCQHPFEGPSKLNCLWCLMEKNCSHFIGGIKEWWNCYRITNPNKGDSHRKVTTDENGNSSRKNHLKRHWDKGNKNADKNTLSYGIPIESPKTRIV